MVAAGSTGVPAAPATATLAEPVSYVQFGGSVSLALTCCASAPPSLVSVIVHALDWPRYAGPGATVFVGVTCGNLGVTVADVFGPV